MTETLGCDIAWNHPSGAQLAAAGYKFASLYVGQDTTGKNMTKAICDDYRAHGVTIVANFEYGAQQMLGGAAQGAADAALGLAQATAAGMPPGRPILFSADWAATTTQIQGSIIPYLVAARGVLGAGRVGVYGSYAVVTAVWDYWAQHYPGEKVYLWQTVAWSNSAWNSADDIRQPGGVATVGGDSLDIDYAYDDDYGQWDLPIPAYNHLREDNMLILRVTGSTSVYGLDGGRLWGMADEPSLQAYINAGVPQVTVSSAELTRIQAVQLTAATVSVTVDSAQLTATLVAALSDAGLLAKQGAALAHAEAVQEHADTPAA